MQEELDKDLLALFEDPSRSLPEEPFLGNVLALIEKQRSRRAFMRGIAYALGIACCALLSPVLIKGSVLLSGGLNVAFAAVNNFVNTSTGMTAAILALIFVFFRRRHIPRPTAVSGGPGL